MNVGVVGRSIERVSFDYAVTLLISGGAEVRIETGFSLIWPSTEAILVDPTRPTGATELTTSTLHMKLTDATVDQVSGSIVLILENGARLEVPADESYEAWTFADGNGIKVVSQPRRRRQHLGFGIVTNHAYEPDFALYRAELASRLASIIGLIKLLTEVQRRVGQAHRLGHDG